MALARSAEGRPTRTGIHRETRAEAPGALEEPRPGRLRRFFRRLRLQDRRHLSKRPRWLAEVGPLLRLLDQRADARPVDVAGREHLHVSHGLPGALEQAPRILQVHAAWEHQVHVIAVDDD